MTDNTQYTFLVKAKDSLGNWTYSNNPSLTVKTTDLSAPRWPLYASLNASDVTASSLVLNWTAASDYSGVAGYKLYGNGQELATIAGNVYSTTLIGLTDTTLYNFSVQAVDNMGYWTTNGPTLNISTASADQWK